MSRNVVALAVLALTLVALPVSAQGGEIEWQAWLSSEAGKGKTACRNFEVVTQRAPDRWQRVKRFESARDLADGFVVRLRGMLTAPETGAYRFQLAVAGTAQLRLGAGSGLEQSPKEAAMLLDVANGTETSAPIELVAGRRYPVEVWHRGGVGPDFLRLGWTRPDGKTEEVIPGEHFARHHPAAAIDAFNYRQARLAPFTRSYDWTRHRSRDRHNPRAGEYLTRETVYAAAAMLGSEDRELWAEAARALREVLPYQNRREDSVDFGNWPRVLERPDDFLAQNVGGFIGGELILILQLYRDRLPGDLVDELAEALRRAAERGRRYDPPVTASNIVTKAVAVGLLADEMVGAPAAGQWAAGRLRELHTHTIATGLPTEYNSPTYNGVVLKALGMLRAFLRDQALRPLVEDIYRATWRELALNYHPNLQLWTGPAARRYEDVFTPGALLQEATGNALFFGESSTTEIALPMPVEFRAFFEPLQKPTERRFEVSASRPVAKIEDQQSPTPLVATVYHAPHFSLGSFNRADLWDQRRALIAYWGRRDAPGFFRVISPSGRAGLLAAQVHTLQQGGEAVMAVTFVTDAGWGEDPYALWRRERTAPVRVADVRLRLVAGGEAASEPWIAPLSLAAPIRRAIDGGQLEVRCLHAGFGASPPRWELTPEGHLDLVLHEGADVELAQLASASVVLSISLGAHDGAPTPVSANVSDGELQVTLGERWMRLPVRPLPYAEAQAAIRFGEPAPAHAASLTPP